MEAGMVQHSVSQAASGLGREPHASSGAGHQQPLAGLKMRTPFQRSVGSAISYGEGCGARELHCVRNGQHALRVHHHFLCKSPEAGQGHHPIANFKAIDGGSEFSNLTGSFGSWNERKRRLFLVLSSNEKEVSEIHARGMHPDSHCAVT
jgi:hypothetical protein